MKKFTQLIENIVESRGINYSASGKWVRPEYRNIHRTQLKALIEALIEESEEVQELLQSLVDSAIDEGIAKLMRIEEDSEREEAGITQPRFEGMDRPIYNSPNL